MDDRTRGRSVAQWFCLIVGATLAVVGLLGFIAEAKFDTSAGGDPGALDGENFVLFEVNGWHNIVHIASGLFLLAASSCSPWRASTGRPARRRWRSARSTRS
jgi:hypothetical protein